MDYLFDEPRDDKLIEDYLFSGYKPSTAARSGFELDQQFAKPIQDEDLFGSDFALETIDQQNDEDVALDEASFNNYTDLPEDSNHETESQLNFEEHPFGDIGGELLNTKNISSIDEVFEDDYSSSEVELSSRNTNCTTNDPQQTTNNENTTPILAANQVNYSRSSKLPPPVSNTQKNLSSFKEKLLQQAKSFGRPQLGAGFKADGTVQVVIDSSQLVSDSNSKFIFNNIFNKSKKFSDKTPEKSKRSWNDLRDSLTKKICAEKRKVWDSFQQPADLFDEEEEFVEPIEDEKEVEEVHEDDDGNKNETTPEDNVDDDLVESGDEQDDLLGEKRGSGDEQDQTDSENEREDSNLGSDNENMDDEEEIEDEAEIEEEAEDEIFDVEATEAHDCQDSDIERTDGGERLLSYSDDESDEEEKNHARKAKIICYSDEDD